MRTRTRRRRLAAGLAGVAAATLTVSTGVASAQDLPITQQVQQQNQWCWVASGLTIAKFFGKGNVSQNDFCNLGRGYPRGSYCPNQAYLEYDQRAFQALGLSPGQVSGPLSFSSVQGEINGQRPILTGIYWTVGGGQRRSSTATPARRCPTATRGRPVPGTGDGVQQLRQQLPVPLGAALSRIGG